MKQEKKILAGGQNILCSTISIPARARWQQNLIARLRLVRCVAEIRQQGKVKMVIPVGKMMNLQGSIRRSTPATLVSIVGTTTIVRQASGMPAE